MPESNRSENLPGLAQLAEALWQIEAAENSGSYNRDELLGDHLTASNLVDSCVQHNELPQETALMIKERLAETVKEIATRHNDNVIAGQMQQAQMAFAALRQIKQQTEDAHPQAKSQPAVTTKAKTGRAKSHGAQ
jgi:hypothetical protein